MLRHVNETMKTLMMGKKKITWRLEEEQLLLLQLVEQLLAELQHPGGEMLNCNLPGQYNVFSTPLTSLSYHTYLSVGKPGGEAVSKGGRGVGGQVGSSLSLHTGCLIASHFFNIETHLDREAGGDGSGPRCGK